MAPSHRPGSQDAGSPGPAPAGPRPRSRRSRLVPLGFALMLAGISLPQALSQLTEGLEPGRLRDAVSWLGALLYAGVFVGLVAAAVGLRRNRRLQRP